MATIETIKELLGEHFTEEVEKEIQAYASTGGEKFVPKQKYDDLLSDRTAKDGTISDLQKQLELLKKEGSQEMKDKIAALQKELADNQADFDARYAARERQYTIDDVLKAAKPKNLNALKGALNGKFDFDKAEVKDGKVTGLEEILTEMRNSDGYLFEESTKPAPSKMGREQGGSAFTSEEDLIRNVAFKAAGLN